MIHEGYRSESDILVRGALKDKARKGVPGTLDFKRVPVWPMEMKKKMCYFLIQRSSRMQFHSCYPKRMMQGVMRPALVRPIRTFVLLERELSEEEATTEVVKASFQPVLDLLPAGLKEDVENELGRKLVSSHA